MPAGSPALGEIHHPRECSAPGKGNHRFEIGLLPLEGISAFGTFQRPSAGEARRQSPGRVLHHVRGAIFGLQQAKAGVLKSTLVEADGGELREAVGTSQPDLLAGYRPPDYPRIREQEFPAWSQQSRDLTEQLRAIAKVQHDVVRDGDVERTVRHREWLIQVELSQLDQMLEAGGGDAHDPP